MDTNTNYQSDLVMADSRKPASDVSKEYTSSHKTELTDDDLLANYYMPRKSCRHCHGRGYIGWWHDDGTPCICRCVTRGGTHRTPMNYGTLKMLLDQHKSKFVE